MNLSNLNKEALVSLGNKYRASFEKNEALRQSKEQEWLESLRQIELVYDPESEAKMGKDEHKMYPGYTRSKVYPLLAKLYQYLLPEKERNWNIIPTPKPTVNKKTLDFVINHLEKTIGAEQINQQTIEMAVKEVIAMRCEKMAIEIQDQLIEDNYRNTLKDFIKSMVIYGTGIMRCPLTQEKTAINIVKKQFNIKDMFFWKKINKWQVETVKEYRPTGECIPIWNFFPDMNAITINKCNFIDYLIPMTKHDLHGLAKREDFFGDIIYDFIKENPEGNYKLRNWENSAQSSSANPTQVNTSLSYEVVERNCYIDGDELKETGIVSDSDIKDEYFCNVWLLGNNIIKIAVWPEDLFTQITDIYHVGYYDKNEVSIFGKGLPRIIRYPQLALAACDRYSLKNAAWVSGPCGEVNIEHLAPGQEETADKLHPGKFFIKSVRGNDGNQRVLHFYNVDSRISDYLALKNDLRNQGDMDSSLPSYLFGNPTPSPDNSVGGARIRFANMIDFVKSVIASIDEAHKAYITAIYKWNMKYNPNEDIKGDMQIQTIGTNAALIKDAAFEQIAFFVQSLPPEGRVYIKWRELIKESIKLVLPDTDKFIKTDEELAQEWEQQAQNQMQATETQKRLAEAKIAKDMSQAQKIQANMQKILANIPHETDSKRIDNENKNIDVAGKLIDMATKISEGQNDEQPPTS